MTAATVRVLSVPSGHRYVDHLAHPDGPDGVLRLPDPAVPGAPAGTWWPPVALDPAWLREHADEVDVVHLHFGFESATPAELTAWTRTLADLGLPWVFTVHDLTNPHLTAREQHRHLAHLDVLVPAADAVLTLTPGAARRVRDRWGVPVHVVPHPHMAPASRVGRRGPRDPGPLRVGVHLKSLRAHVDPGVVTALERACAHPGLRDHVELHVHVHEEVRDPGFVRHDPGVVTMLEDTAARGVAAVHWVPRMDDAQLWDYLGGLDVSVLPYAWGTHSGWLEECRDLGTAVLAPDVGHYAEQGTVATYRVVDGVPSTEDLVTALEQLLGERPAPVSARWRAAQRREVAHTHRRIYATVLARRPGRVAA